MIIPTRCYLNGNDTWNQFELVMSSKNIAPAKAKQNFMEIPARNGDLDLSEALMGIPFYGNREITITLGGKKARAEWTRTLSNVQNKYHNRKVQVIFEDDSSYYWEGRLTVNDDFELGMRSELFPSQSTLSHIKWKRAMEEREPARRGIPSCLRQIYSGIIMDYRSPASLL